MTANSIIIYDTEVQAIKGSALNDWGMVNDTTPHVVNIAAVRVALDDDLTLRSTFNKLVIPYDRQGRMMPVSAYTTNLTGITQAQMDAEGESMIVVAKDFADFIADDQAFSWGVEFDYTKLVMGCLYSGMSEVPFKSAQFRDLRPIAAQGGVPADRMPQNDPDGKVVALEDKINSGSLARHLGIALENHREHDGMCDVHSLHASLKFLIKEKRIALSALHP